LQFEEQAIVNIVKTAECDDERVASWEFRQKPYEHPKYYDPVTQETNWSSHACILFRSNAFRAVGGYEEKIFMYGEDVELSYRMRDSGFTLKYCPRASVWHHTYEKPATVKPLQFAGSTLANAYIRMRYGTFVDILTIPSMFLILLGKAAFVENGNRIIFSNLMKTIRHLPYFLTTRKKSTAYFPLRRWDYELTRMGAFYEYRQLGKYKAPLVSIIVRTHAARERSLIEAITTVVNQTYSNIELIIVEDGSHSFENIVETITEKVSICISYHSLPKHGRSYAGNYGLSIAKGAFIMFLDDDDLIFSDHVEVLAEELINNKHIAAAYAVSWEVETRTAPDLALGYEELVHKTPSFLQQEFSRSILSYRNYIPIQAILFRRELYEKYGGFDEELDQLEDWNMWCRYASHDDFKYIEKTTSLFRTPYELNIRAKRQEVLDSAYSIVHSKNKEIRDEPY
jgi:GT2 family glycosyltransferase